MPICVCWQAGKGEKIKTQEKSMFHGKEERDKLGRSWMDPPKEQKPEVEQAFLPKRWIHTWSGHTKGVNAIRYLYLYTYLWCPYPHDSCYRLRSLCCIIYCQEMQPLNLYMSNIAFVFDQNMSIELSYRCSTPRSAIFLTFSPILNNISTISQQSTLRMSTYIIGSQQNKLYHNRPHTNVGM